jgi:hypothetical protein
VPCERQNNLGAGTLKARRGGVASGIFSRNIAVMLIGLVIILSTGALAQTPADRTRQMPTGRTSQKSSIDLQVERLNKRLDLTAAQQLSARKILDHERHEFARVWDNPSVEPIARTTKLRALRDDAARQIRAILNEEQKKKYMIVPEHPATNSKSLNDNYNKYVGAR